jgi:ABC-type transport system involved in multi-copper enzyme maturation permease subunit
MIYIAIVWIPAVEIQRSAVLSRAQMEAAAKIITQGIVCFQFYGAQVVAIIIMSTAIGEEVYGRTLAVLMTTPLSSRQLVASKFFSRLFQIVLLVMASLPLLAVVRVLGGIPWGYLVLSLCLTLAVTAYVGSVSLFFSALCRRAYLVVIASTLGAPLLLFLVPATMALALGIPLPRLEEVPVVLCLNPYILLDSLTDYMTSPRRAAAGSVPALVLCCGLLVGLAHLFLRLSVRLVRSVSLRCAMGEPTRLDVLRFRRRRDVEIDAIPGQRSRGIRRVTGPPMIWKELTRALTRRERLVMGIVVGMEVLLIFIAYSFPAITTQVSYEAAHVLYLWVFLALGIHFTVTASATVISAERESQAWSLLLLTPLTSRDILIGKFVGVLRRCGLIWLALFAYVAAFTYAHCFRPLAVAQVTIVIVSVVLFLSATGFYFGLHYRRATEAVTANLVLAGSLWVVLPILMYTALRGFTHDWNDSLSLTLASVPFGQALAMIATTLEGGEGQIELFDDVIHASGMTGVMLLAMLAYTLASLGFAWRAMRAFRRNIV